MPRYIVAHPEGGQRRVKRHRYRLTHAVWKRYSDHYRAALRAAGRADIAAVLAYDWQLHCLCENRQNAEARANSIGRAIVAGRYVERAETMITAAQEMPNEDN